MKLGEFIKELQQWEDEYGSDCELYIDYESDLTSFDIDSVVIDEEEVESDEWEVAVFVTTPCYYSKQNWIHQISDEDIEEMAREQGEVSINDEMHDLLMREFYKV